MTVKTIAELDKPRTTRVVETETTEDGLVWWVVWAVDTQENAINNDRAGVIAQKVKTLVL